MVSVCSCNQPLEGSGDHSFFVRVFGKIKDREVGPHGWIRCVLKHKVIASDPWCGCLCLPYVKHNKAALRTKAIVDGSEFLSDTLNGVTPVLQSEELEPVDRQVRL